MALKSLDDQAIFEVARKIGSTEARQAYLAQICGDDLATTDRIKALLRANDDSASFLECPPTGIGRSPTLDSSVPEHPGMQIGRYKLLQQIGEGGMGVVYMAEQTEPVQRKVALKVIKPGMDSRQVVARFEAERQALAVLDHVNIARVLDAGATESGRPYFVMELVHGVPITNYCDDNRLTSRQRLELFLPVCLATQHAHQKGIIHRDIKPSNVMVTLYDGKPVAKMIDFGVAKATEQKLTERTLFTQYGAMIGTLEYMSPEQAEMSALGVDTRSDIYSLGVLLYELLTGSTPLSSKRMKGAAYDEILRLIREEEPPKPSTRLSESGQELASISAQRHTEPAQLTKLMRGELDWIVMKTLEKDRNRRYETANSFAADVLRYLNDEPVEACPPSAGYRLRKLLRKNKVTVITSLLIAGSLVLGTTVSTWQALVARRAERHAEESLVAESLARQQAMAVSRLLQEGLASANPDSANGNDYTVRQLLDNISAKLADQLRDQPSAEAAIRATIGNAYFRLGAPEQAAPHLKRALELREQSFGPDHVEVARSLHDEAWNLQEYGDVQGAEAGVRRALAIHHKLQLRNSETVRILWLLQLVLRRDGQETESEQAGREALAIAKELPDAGPEMANILHTLAESARARDDFEEAERLARESIRLHRRFHGDHHPQAARAQCALGTVLVDMKKYDEAEPYLRESIASFAKHFDYIAEGSLPAFASLVRVLNAKNDQAGLKSLRGEVAARADLIVKQRSSDEGPLFYAALALAIVDDTEGAIDIYSQIVANNPGQLKVWYKRIDHLAWLLSIRPDSHQRHGTVPIALAHQAVQLAPRNAKVWTTLGVAYYRAGDWTSAIAALKSR